MDLRMGDDLYESFIRYQKWLLAEFDKMVEPNGFEIVDASNSIEEVFETLRRRIDRVIARNGDWAATECSLMCPTGFPNCPAVLHFASVL